MEERVVLPRPLPHFAIVSPVVEVEQHVMVGPRPCHSMSPARDADASVAIVTVAWILHFWMEGAMNIQQLHGIRQMKALRSAREPMEVGGTGYLGRQQIALNRDAVVECSAPS